MDDDFWKSYEEDSLREAKEIRQLMKKNPGASPGADAKLERWARMLEGDEKALIELLIERGMAKKEDFNFMEKEFFNDEG